MSPEMSQTLTQTSAGTPMGNLMRRYWVPVVMSSEIAEADGPQVRCKSWVKNCWPSATLMACPV